MAQPSDGSAEAGTQRRINGQFKGQPKRECYALPFFMNPTIQEFYRDAGQNPRLLVLYGSRIPTSDQDYLVILSERQGSPNCVLARYDILQLDMEEASALTQLRDPIITEPILTGTPIPGYEDEFKKYLQLLKESPITPAISSHLLKCAIREYQKVSQFAPALRNRRDLAEFASTAAFAVSYLTFARYYSEHSLAITLAQLMETVPTLRKVVDLKRSARTIGLSDAQELVENCLRIIEQHFLKA